MNPFEAPRTASRLTLAETTRKHLQAKGCRSAIA